MMLTYVISTFIYFVSRSYVVIMALNLQIVLVCSQNCGDKNFKFKNYEYKKKRSCLNYKKNVNFLGTFKNYVRFDVRGEGSG